MMLICCIPETILSSFERIAHDSKTRSTGIAPTPWPIPNMVKRREARHCMCSNLPDAVGGIAGEEVANSELAPLPLSQQLQLVLCWGALAVASVCPSVRNGRARGRGPGRRARGEGEIGADPGLFEQEMRQRLSRRPIILHESILLLLSLPTQL